MADEEPKSMLAQMLVMTPQLQQAIKMLATPAVELGAMVDKLRADHPGYIVEPGPDAPDLGERVDREDADPELPPFEWIEPPFPPRAELADVFVFGNPPEVRANLAALPRIALAAGAPADVEREARWLVRAFRQRGRTCEKVVAVLVEHNPQLAIAESVDGLPRLSPRTIGEAIGMHESTITRVAAACRIQNLHGVFAIAPLVGGKRKPKPKPKPSR